MNSTPETNYFKLKIIPWFFIPNGNSTRNYIYLKVGTNI